MKGYIETGEVFARDKGEISIKSVVLDVDGVLVDVSGSFRQTIVDTVQFYFERVLKVPGKGKLLTVWDTQSFKNAGGFNNDCDLTKAAVLFFLSKLVSAPKRDIVVCRYSGASLLEFLRNVSLKGGGLDAAKDTAMDPLSPNQRKEILGLYNPIYITKIFQELYGGTDFCRKLYGFEPKWNRGRGLINMEKSLIDPELAKGFDKLAVITGRSMKETDVALSLTNMGSVVSRDYVVYDNGRGPVKPDEHLLTDLCTKMGVYDGIYIGDNVDDALLVANYNANTTKGRFNFGAVTIRPDTFYGKADIMAKDVNSILRYLKVLQEAQSEAG